MNLVDLAVGILGGAFFSWLISRHFHKKAERDLRDENERFVRKLKWENTEDYFQAMLSNGAWEDRHINGIKQWVCKNDNNLSIEECDDSEPFVEPWTNRFADQRAFKSTVKLKRGSQVFKELIFVDMDSHRVTVPLPRVLVPGGGAPGSSSPMYYWDRSSIEFKVGKIIGDYYIHDGIEDIARICGVDILSGHERT
jgi:hypothetical protein